MRKNPSIAIFLPSDVKITTLPKQAKVHCTWTAKTKTFAFAPKATVYFKLSRVARWWLATDAERRTDEFGLGRDPDNLKSWALPLSTASYDQRIEECLTELLYLYWSCYFRKPPYRVPHYTELLALERHGFRGPNRRALEAFLQDIIRMRDRDRALEVLRDVQSRLFAEEVRLKRMREDFTESVAVAQKEGLISYEKARELLTG